MSKKHSTVAAQHLSRQPGRGLGPGDEELLLWSRCLQTTAASALSDLLSNKKDSDKRELLIQLPSKQADCCGPVETTEALRMVWESVQALHRVAATGTQSLHLDTSTVQVFQQCQLLFKEIENILFCA